LLQCDTLLGIFYSRQILVRQSWLKPDRYKDEDAEGEGYRGGKERPAEPWLWSWSSVQAFLRHFSAKARRCRAAYSAIRLLGKRCTVLQATAVAPYPRSMCSRCFHRAVRHSLWPASQPASSFRAVHRECFDGSVARPQRQNRAFAWTAAAHSYAGSPDQAYAETSVGRCARARFGRPLARMPIKARPSRFGDLSTPRARCTTRVAGIADSWPLEVSRRRLPVMLRRHRLLRTGRALTLITQSCRMQDAGYKGGSMRPQCLRQPERVAARAQLSGQHAADLRQGLGASAVFASRCRCLGSSS
jgi:hypothetical protein